MKRSLGLVLLVLPGGLAAACQGELNLGGGGRDAGLPPAATDAGSGRGGGGASDDGGAPGGDDAGYTSDGSSASPEGGSTGPNAWLAFDSNLAGARGIYIVHRDGTGLLELTATLEGESEPAFSPDGTKLAYTSTATGTPQIVVRDLVSGTKATLTSHAQGAHQPAWSPDGTLIAFTDVPQLQDGGSLVESIHGGALFVVAPDGTGEREVFGVDSTSASDGGSGLQPSYPYNYPTNPVFSSDSTRIYFAASGNISSIVKDGTGLLTIAATTYTADSVVTPAVSPDGTQVMYAQVDDQGSDIFKASATGYAVTSVNPPPATFYLSAVYPSQYRKPAWSSSSVAYEKVSLPDNVANIGITVPDEDGGIVLAGPDDERNPTWAPSGFSAAILPAGTLCPAGCSLVYTTACQTNACACPTTPSPFPSMCEVAPAGTDAGAPGSILACCDSHY